jgi:hypothetical protein
MKRTISFVFVLPIAVLLLLSCNAIENADLSLGSIIEQQSSAESQEFKVTLTEANEIADFFVGSSASGNLLPTKSADTREHLISTSETLREDGQDLMYVFNYQDGGFVIVGSTRNYYPILAYSDKGAFVLQDDMGPVDVWLDETKVCIKNSPSLNEETKALMHQLWARYDGTYPDPSLAELAARRPQTRSTGEDYCWERCEALQAQYGNQGWTFYPLSFVEDMFSDAGLSSDYANICYSASQNNSALNETVFGYKNVTPSTNQIGPLLSTAWHQGSPFNSLCTPYAAGCGPIAAAQVMFYHQYPQQPMSWNNIYFTWADISAYPDTSSSSRQPHLIMMLRQRFGVIFTGTTLGDIVNGMISLGYSVTNASFNALSVRNELYNNNRPVLMDGYKIGSNPSDPLDMVSGHCWVCEGAKEITADQIQYFTENQPYGAGTFTQGMYSYSSPGTLGGNVYLYFYMNWGWGASYNGWYTYNDVNSSGGNFQYFRSHILISTP